MITYTDMLILIHDYIYRYVNTNPWLHTLIMLILIHDYICRYVTFWLHIHICIINPWLNIQIC